MAAPVGRLASLIRRCTAVLLVLPVLVIAQVAVPAYMLAQADALAASAARHGVPPAWLAAVLYNEMLGTEDQVLRTVLPGEDTAPRTARAVLLGLHFMTLKQAQWQVKAMVALSGADPTVGPAGIRVTVGREIRSEQLVSAGNHVSSGPLERPSMISDLTAPATAIEYLAANLERGQDRLALPDRGDWDASARWHNTGVVYDSAIVRPEDWDKGSRYVGRVRTCLPLVAAILGGAQPVSMEDTSRPLRTTRAPSQAQTALAESPNGQP